MTSQEEDFKLFLFFSGIIITSSPPFPCLLEKFYKKLFAMHIVYYLLKIKSNLHTNEMGMIIYFYVKN